jgi:phage terminase large subunit
VPEAEKWPITADSARPETIAHIRKNGFPKVMPAVKGPRSVEEGIEFLKSFEIIVHPRCVHTADELTLYSYEVDKLTGMVLPKLAGQEQQRD